MADVGGVIVEKFMKTATKESFKAKVASKVSELPGDGKGSAKKAALGAADWVLTTYDTVSG